MANDERGNKIDGFDNVEKEFFKKLDDDFNIPEALGQLFGLIRQVNPLLKIGVVNKKDGQSILEFIENIFLALHGFA